MFAGFISLLTAMSVASCGGDPDAPPDAPSARGRTFYLSLAGDDANPGDGMDRAWRSLERASRHDFAPGDRLLLEGGTRFEGTLTLTAADGGDPELPLRVSSYGIGSESSDGRATIDAGEGDGIVIADVSGLIVERLNITGGWRGEAQAGNDGEGVSATGTVSGERRRGLTLRELDVRGFKHAGIRLRALPRDEAKNSGYESVQILDCVVHDNGDVGIATGGPYVYDGPGYSHRDVRVERVRAHHNRGLRNKGEHTGSGIVLSDVDGAVIEHSIAHDNGEWNDHAAGGGFGIWAWDSNDVLIQFNESYDNKTGTTDGGGFDLDGGVTNSVLQYNYSHGNQGAGFGAFQFAWARPFSGNVIRYNISQNDGFAFLAWDGNGDLGSLAIVHNVGYGPNPVLATYSSFRDVTIANNVFYGTGPVLFDVFDDAGLTLQGNAYWTDRASLHIEWDTGTTQAATFSDFDAYRAATNQETQDGRATGLSAAPGFVAAGSGMTLDDGELLATLTMYQLQADSPLIDRGVDLAELGIEGAAQRDFFGEETPLGAAPDIGVHEAR